MKITSWIVLTLLVGATAAQAELVTVGENPCQRYEWRASTYVPSSQSEAALAVASDGTIVTTWTSRRQLGGRSGVYFQRFDGNGVALGSETPVAVWTQSHQSCPAVAVDGLGQAWFVWESFGQDGSGGAILARRFDATWQGGSEIAVNEKTRGHQFNPAIAASRSGGAAVVWQTQPSANESRVAARLFDRNGQAVGGEFEVGGAGAVTPSVAIADDGTVAVAYAVFEAGEPVGIRLQRFDAAGRSLGGEIAVSGADMSGSIEPVIAAAPWGYVVAWVDSQVDGDAYGVLARRLDRNGAPLGDAFVVNTEVRDTQTGPSVAVAADGRFAIAWNHGYKHSADVVGQMFAPDGRRLGGEFRVNRNPRHEQMMRVAAGTQRLAFTADGALVCTWSGNGKLGDDKGVHVSMLTPRLLQLAGAVQGVRRDMQPAPHGALTVAAADTPTPHIPPTFDPTQIDDSEREIRSRDADANFGFTAITSTGWTPPDPHMGVGPDHIMVMTNGAIAAFRKDGTKIWQKPIEGAAGFWGSLGATGFVFDPETFYDELSGRFWAMAAEGRASGRSFVLVAVSKTGDPSDPNNGWHKYRFDTTTEAGDLFDSPNIGVDKDVLYVTGDGFGNGATYPIYAWDKASILAGQPPQKHKKMLLPTSTQSAGISCVSYGDPPAYYLMEHQEGSNRTGIRLIALQDPLNTMTWKDFVLTVPAYSAPGDPVQKGTSTRPETFDARFWSVVYRNGSFWGTHHTDDPVRVRWYEIKMNGWPDSGKNPELVQSGVYWPSNDLYLFFNSLSVDPANNMALTTARSSANEYISIVTTFRLRNDPLGQLRPGTFEKINTGPYNSGRWGDYSAVGRDVKRANVFWAHHEYAEGNSWRTWVSEIKLPGKGDMNCDGLLNFGDINPFVLALSNPAEYKRQYPDCEILNGDINEDGNVDFGDINPFVELLGS